MKKKFFLFIFIIIGISFFIYHQTYKVKNSISRHRTFEKQDKKIISHQTTQKELKKANLISLKKQPSQVPTPSHKLLINGLPVIGPLANNLLKNKDMIEFVNTPSDYWQDSLGIELMKFQSPDTKVIITKRNSFIESISNNKARYVKEIIVTFNQGPQKPITSFKALVDLESGKILKTWDQTKIENLITRPPRFAPNGGL